ncbi:hypothetical protein NYO99_17630 [Pelomonas sp. UHG3]|uniref:Uncharacterized protein n=1 Tax=Roseateles hydrophilus TaxID=2975054 RepID=A0ACC6CEK7_9BURK|nr:hypothetical protein [Pelomonas sp. UHG3]
MRSLLRIGTQIAAAASAAVLPFAVIAIFGQDGFRHFSSAYTIYTLALFLGTLGLDLAMARLDISLWRACTFLAVTVGSVGALLSLGSSNPISTQVRLCVIATALTGAWGSYLTNRIYFRQTAAGIKAIAWIRIATALVGVSALVTLANPLDGIYVVLAQNIVIASTALIYARGTTPATQISTSMSKLPAHAVTALASFFTFSFAGLLQAYERYIAAAIDHPFVGTYLVFSTYLSALTYLGTGVERSEYTKPQTTRRILKSFGRLGLLAFSIGLLTLLIIYMRAQPYMDLGFLAVLAYITLATTVHIASYFSAAPFVFISFSEADIKRLALTNVCVAAMPLGIVTAISVTGLLGSESAILVLALTIPTAVWMSSLIRMRFAIHKIKTTT